MELQRRHYALIADIIANSLEDGMCKEEIARQFSRRLCGTNPNFNRARFERAATGNPDGRDRAALNR